MLSNTFHQPVLLNETLTYLKPAKNKVIVDCTLGGGGHSLKLLELGAKVIGIDQDIEAINAAKLILKKENNRFSAIQGNFKDIDILINEKVDGFLLDLGVSSHQFNTPERGFSLREDGPLDMRMDISQNLTAEKIINTYSEKDLDSLLKDFGETRFHKKIVSRIISYRKTNEIKTTLELKGIIESVINFLPPKVKLTEITKIFQAFRIATNHELSSLLDVLPKMLKLLNPNGKIVAISYHSLEDRIIKTFFKREAQDCLCPKEEFVCRCNHKKEIKILTKKPITPTMQEIKENSRARSAKLRAAEKL